MVDPANRQLLNYITRWDRRLRLTQLTLWVPRGLAVGLLVGLGIALLSRVRPWLLPTQIVAITGLAVLLGLVIAVVAVWLWPRPTIKAARYFDRIFGLKERSSTALELANGLIQAPPVLAARQLEDTVTLASKVEPRRYLRFQWRRREISALVLLALVLTLALLVANPQTEVLAQQSAVKTAVNEQVNKLQQIKQAVQNNPQLTDSEKAQLSKILDETIQDLQQPNVTQAEAVAALSKAQQELNSAKTQLNAQQQSLARDAGNALDQNANTKAAGQDLKANDLNSAAADLQNLAQKVGDGQLTSDQQKETADALDQAAKSLQNVNPQAADALKRAANALRNGDTAAAKQALNDAASALQNQQQQMNQTAMSQAAQNAASQTGNSQQQVAQAGTKQGALPQQQQQQAGQGQQGNSQQQQVGQGQQQPVPPQGQQQGQQSSASSQGQNNSQQQGSQQGQDQLGNPSSNTGQGQQGNSQNQQPMGSGQSGANNQQNGQQNGQQQGQGQSGGQGQQGQGADQTTGQAQGGSGSGAGQEQGGSGNDVTHGNPTNGGPIDPNNGHSDGSLTNNEPVYAPSFVGGSGGTQLNPSSDNPGNSNDPSQQADPNNSFAGTSTTPLSSIIGNVSAQADKAMDSDHVPGALRGVIRDYFTGLQSQ